MNSSFFISSTIIIIIIIILDEFVSSFSRLSHAAPHRNYVVQCVH